MDKGLIVHAILFNNDKKVLVIRRSLNEDVLPGAWDIPGGTLEDGEDPKSGAIRETKEETGIEIDSVDLFTFTSNVDQKKDKQFVRLIFIGNTDGSSKITLNEEDHDMYRWISVNAIPDDVHLVGYLHDIFSSLEKNDHQLLQFNT